MRPTENLIVLILTCRLSPPQRIAHALAQARLHFPDHEVTVVDGLTGDDPETAALLDHRRACRLSKRIPTLREVATYGTHRRGWEQLLDSGAGAALVLEDDFEVTDPQMIGHVIRRWPDIRDSGVDIVKLFDFPRRRPGGTALVRHVGEVELVNWAAPRAGLVGYVITQEGARKFLARRQVFRVVDEDIKHYWELGLRIWSLRSDAVTDASARLGGSLLETGRKTAKTDRSLRRSLHGLWLTTLRRLRGMLAFRLDRLRAKDAVLRRL